MQKAKRERKYRQKTVWFNQRGQFAKKPHGKTPAGWKKRIIKYPLLSRLSLSEKRIRETAKTEKKFKKEISKKLPRLKIGEIKPTGDRHLRFRTEKDSQWKRPGSRNFKAPRKGSKYQIAIFEGNELKSFWGAKTYRKWDSTLESATKSDTNKIRFPEGKRVEFTLSGKTLKDALSIISINGTVHGTRLFYDMHLSGRLQGDNQRIKFHHQSVIHMNTTYGMSYDNRVTEVLDKVFRAELANQNARFTSREVLINLAKKNERGNLSMEWALDKIRNQQQLVDVRGSFVGMIG